MSRRKYVTWKTICLAIMVPALMAMTVPVRAWIFDSGAGLKSEPAPGDDTLAWSTSKPRELPAEDKAAIFDWTDDVSLEAQAPEAEVAIAGADMTKVDVAPPSRSIVKPVPSGPPPEPKLSTGSMFESSTPGWWSGLSTTNKAALIGAPIGLGAGVGLAVSGDGSSSHTVYREASPMEPEDD